MLKKRRKNGIEARRGANGIGCTLFPLETRKYAKRCARTAERRSKRKKTANVSVRTLAKAHGAEKRVSMTRKERANGAEPFSSQTSTANGVSAVKVARVRRTGEVKPVYNLTVDETHNFAVNGGLVTHNCDAMRYFVQTVGLQELSCFEWD